MSLSAAAPEPTTVAEPPRDNLVGGLLDRLAIHLAPLFVSDITKLAAARQIAVRTIIAYRPETEADLISIGRIISFSMSALAALGRAAPEDMPAALQLRYLGRANTLNRSADQSERAMDRRRRYQRSIAPSEQTDYRAAAFGRGGAESDVAAEAAFDRAFDEAAIDAAVAEAIRTCRSEASDVPPPETPVEVPVETVVSADDAPALDASGLVARRAVAPETHGDGLRDGLLRAVAGPWATGGRRAALPR